MSLNAPLSTPLIHLTTNTIPTHDSHTTTTTTTIDTIINQNLEMAYLAYARAQQRQQIAFDNLRMYDLLHGHPNHPTLGTSTYIIRDQRVPRHHRPHSFEEGYLPHLPTCPLFEHRPGCPRAGGGRRAPSQGRQGTAGNGQGRGAPAAQDQDQGQGQGQDRGRGGGQVQNQCAQGGSAQGQSGQGQGAPAAQGQRNSSAQRRDSEPAHEVVWYDDLWGPEPPPLYR